MSSKSDDMYIFVDVAATCGQHEVQKEAISIAGKCRKVREKNLLGRFSPRKNSSRE